MTESRNDRYRRKYPAPEQWVSQQPANSEFADRAVEQTRRNINELQWAFRGAEVADNAAAWLRAPQVADEAQAFLARVERRRIAKAENWRQGEPGE